MSTMPAQPGGGNRLVLSVEEAAGLLGISRGLAYELVTRKELPHIRLGRRIVVPKKALLELLAAAEPVGDSSYPGH